MYYGDEGSAFQLSDIVTLTVEAPHSHVWSETWSADESCHWHECVEADCDIINIEEKDGYGEHTPEADDGDCTTAVVCSECGEVLAEAEEHSFLDYIYQNDATYDSDGTEIAACGNDGCGVTDIRDAVGTRLVHNHAWSIT